MHSYSYAKNQPQKPTHFHPWLSPYNLEMNQMNQLFFLPPPPNPDYSTHLSWSFTTATQSQNLTLTFQLSGVLIRNDFQWASNVPFTGGHDLHSPITGRSNTFVSSSFSFVFSHAIRPSGRAIKACVSAPSIHSLPCQPFSLRNEIRKSICIANTTNRDAGK